VCHALDVPIAVYLEIGKKKVFAAAVDWPGWCRSGRTDEEALEALTVYRDRYAAVVAEAGLELPRQREFTIVERVPGSATTDFGAPAAVPEVDVEAKLTARQADRLAALVEASWRVFDAVVATAPASLRKGPRGGGRDTDAVAAHVHNAERSYGGKLGLPPKQRSREDIPAALRAAPPDAPWPPQYTARRLAWHVLDHAWEIEDRSR
jgi:hypothetical protein